MFIHQKTMQFDNFQIDAIYDSHIERIMPDGCNTIFCEGYVCGVYEITHGQRTNLVDKFALAVGCEIEDLSDEELLRAAENAGCYNFESATVKRIISRTIRSGDYRIIANLSDDVQRISVSENLEHCDGWNCSVYDADDESHPNATDIFSLAIGYEIEDLSDAELMKGIQEQMPHYTKESASVPKYPFKAMDSDFIASLTADVKAALSGVEKKYGVRLDCWSAAGTPGCQNIYESVNLNLRAEFTYEGCDPQREHFGFQCHEEKLEQYGIGIDAYGKTFAVDGKEFRVVGLDTKRHSVNCVTVACGGDLYQFHPHTVGSALGNNVSDSTIKDIQKVVLNQSKHFTQRGKAELQNALCSYEDWCRIIGECEFWNKPTGLTAQDHGRTVTLYGKMYTVKGFVFNLADKRAGMCAYRVVLSDGDTLFSAPVSNVSFALAHEEVRHD